MSDIYDMNQTSQLVHDENINSVEKSAEFNFGYQLFDVLDETFSTYPSNESDNTADLMKKYKSQAKKGLNTSSDSCDTYSYSRVSEETTQTDCTSQSKESNVEYTCSSDDDNFVAGSTSDETGSVKENDILEDKMDWKDMVSEILPQWYNVSVDKLGRLLYDVSEFSNGFSKKSNQASNETEGLEEEKTEFVVEKKIEKQHVVLTREEQRKKLKAELATMDAETAHKFKLMLLKHKKNTYDSIETRHDTVIEKRSNEIREGEIGC